MENFEDSKEDLLQDLEDVLTKFRGVKDKLLLRKLFIMLPIGVPKVMIGVAMPKKRQRSFYKRQLWISIVVVKHG